MAYKPGQCFVCNKTSSMMCQLCGEDYCSAECQVQDWPAHKYICHSMPALVIYEQRIGRQPGKKSFNATKDLQNVSVNSQFNIESNHSGIDTSQSKKQPISTDVKQNTKLSTAWRECVKLPSERYLNCVLNSVDFKDVNIVWLTAANHVEQRELLENDLKQFVSLKNQMTIEKITIDTLCVVQINDKLFRAVLVAIQTNSSDVLVRLIDYGSEHVVPLKSVYDAVPQIADVNKYAFSVKLQKEVSHSDKFVMIRLSHKSGGIQTAQLMPAMPLQILEENPKVSVAKIFENGRVALVYVGNKEEINSKLEIIMKSASHNSDLNLKDDNKHIFLAAKTENGWRRVYLIDCIQQQSLFLVYAIDDGLITLCSEVRRLPFNILQQPVGVLSITVDAGPYDKRLMDVNDLNLQLALDKDSDKYKKILKAHLQDCNRKLYEVRVKHFMGNLRGFGLSLWRSEILEGSSVYIVNVITYAELNITSKRCQDYPNIFRKLAPKCESYQNKSEVKNGDIVLVVKNTQECFRGEIMSIPLKESEEFAVYDLDTGVIQTTLLQYLRKANDFIYYLPVMLKKVIFNTLSKIPQTSVPPNNKAMSMLQEYVAERNDFKIKYEVDSNGVVVDLVFSNRMEKLSSKIIEFLFMVNDNVDLNGKNHMIQQTSCQGPNEEMNAAELQGKTRRQSETVYKSKSEADEVFDKFNFLNVDQSASLINPNLLDKKMPRAQPGASHKSPTKQTVEQHDVAFATPLPPSPPPDRLLCYEAILNSKKKYETFKLKDIERKEIPTGKNLEIFILDKTMFTDLGFFYAAYFANLEELKKFENLRTRVTKYSQCAHKKFHTDYKPEDTEICLALFPEDNLWYRAVYYSQGDANEYIQFLDYGNVQKFAIDRVQPIPKDLLFPSYGVTCYVEGFDPKTHPDPAIIENLNNRIKIECEYVKRKGDAFIVKLKNAKSN